MNITEHFRSDFPNAARQLESKLGPLTRTQEESRQVPTGIPRLDVILRGGIPTGMTEVCGPPSAGKTALLGSALAQAQKAGMPTFLCVGEYLDMNYLRRAGVNLNDLGLIFGGYAEFGDMFLEAASLPIPTLVAVDSMTAISMSESWTSDWFHLLREARGRLKNGSAIIASSQVRSRASANPAVERLLSRQWSHARKLSDLFDCRLNISRAEVSERSYTMVLEVLFSSTCPPGSIITMPVDKGHGVDVLTDTLRLAKELGVIELRGSWYYFNNVSMGQGEAAAASHIRATPGLYTSILERLLS